MAFLVIKKIYNRIESDSSGKVINSYTVSGKIYNRIESRAIYPKY